MADQTSPRGPPPAPAEARQQEQTQPNQNQQNQQQSTPVQSPTSPSSTFHQHPPQQYYSPPYQNPQDPRHPQHPHPQQFAPSNMQQPYYRQQGPGGAMHHHGPYDMHGMAQNLPQPDYRQQQQYGSPGNRGGPRGYTLGPVALQNATGHPGQQYATHTGGMQQTFYMPQQQPMMGQPYYGGGPARYGGGNSGGYSYYGNQAQTPTGYYYPQQPGQYTHQQHQHHQPMHQQGSTPGSGACGNYAPSAHTPRRPSQPMVVTGNPLPDGVNNSPRPDQHERPHPGLAQTQTASVVRGPPRKPKQSGHAIWIGNLPPQTNLMSLVHHVCQQTDGLESLFLISKSNCAFANYPDEERCLAAQQKLNDTWYMSVRLVSRLRKNAVEGAQGITAPTGPTALSASSTASSLPHTDGDSAAADGTDDSSTANTAAADGTTAVDALATPKQPTLQTSVIVDGSGKSGATLGAASYEAGRAATAASTPVAAKSDRYFILKSLTVEDLELSVRTGIWATQSHNEETLNEAFKSSENVYLVFSANKSGEYFGYARMTSEINQDPAAAIAFAPTAQAFTGVDLPKAIPTEANESTPRGRIIDDSARGTIFWEAQREDVDGGAEDTNTKQEEDTTTDGVDGADGTDGTDGVDGIDGTDGADGTDGTDGADGTDGTDGAEGTYGIDGTDGVDGAEETKAWGKPFQLEWLSTARLPFYRTRGMRNPLNSNREIKIARDGTEVDSAIGRKLATFFHQGTSTSPAASGSSGGKAAM